MSVVIAVLIVLSVVCPILLGRWKKLKLEISDHQYELVRKAVEDAVCHVHKVSDVKELSSGEKKIMASRLARTIAGKIGVSTDKQELIDDLIESVLWKQESGEIVEEDDTY